MWVQEVGCKDIDECLKPEAGNYCGPYSKCYDIDGWTSSTIFSCGCVSGYDSWSAYSGCQDINECCNKNNSKCTHNCDLNDNKHCVNTQGSFTCEICIPSGTLLFSDS